ncbi:MAG: hypothetical protein ACI87E_002700 [Mariniblastus sp.]|jgi:hypothetical protein
MRLTHRGILYPGASKPIAMLAALAMTACFTLGCQAQSSKVNTTSNSDGERIPSGIAWYGVLADGVAEAKATNRPIFLMSAAPQCAGIPGMW